MNRFANRGLLLVATLFLSNAFLSPTIAQSKRDWRKATVFPGLQLTQLTSAQRNAVLDRLRQANCPCGCGMKIAECLIDDPTCPRSPGIARQIVQEVVRGKTQQQYAGVLHAILIFDRFDESVGPHCAAAAEYIGSLLEHNIAGRSLHLDLTMEDYDSGVAKLTPESVLHRINRLKVGPADSVLVYFNGHGGYSKEHGQFFYMHHSSTVLKRDSVREALLRLNPRLGVLISECCYGKATPEAGVMDRHPNEETRRLMDSLFFKHTGFVDITSSSKDQLSICRGGGELGGIFSVAFSETAEQNMDRALTWQEFHRLVSDSTESYFDHYAPNGHNGQFDQTPHAFSLGTPVK